MRRSESNKTPGGLFVNYLIIGLALLFGVIFLGHAFDGIIERKYFISLGILISNLIVVFLFTASVLSRQDLLSNLDSPDMAYYLGFSLTVGALAFSFMVDMFFGGAALAAERSRIIENALSIFGTGLLATLFGLVAKIFIASRQSEGQMETDQLYSRFRGEVDEFSKLIRQMSIEMSSSLNYSVDQIKLAGSSGANSMVDLAKELALTKDRLRSELSVENIEKPIKDFVFQLNSIHPSVEKLNQEIASLSLILKTNVGVIDGANNSLKLVDNQLDQHAKKLVQINESVAELNVKTIDLTQSNDGLSASAKLSKVAMKSFGSGLERLSADFIPPAIEAFSPFKDGLFATASDLSALSNAFSPVTSQLELLNSSLNDSLSKFNRLASNFESFGGAMTSMHAPVENLSVVLDGLSKISSSLNVNMLQFDKNLSQDSEGLKILNAQLLEFKSIISNSVSAVKDLQSSINESRNSLVSFGGGVNQFKIGLDGGRQSVDGFGRNLQSLSSHLSRMESMAIQINSSTQK